ncbi:hypothetical protein ABT063_31075 [Streptomyces sp. NPDC002838]|uniref:hypothetical protein n=1 Tax=Streptomyces sp. NPDC002838 TaxID=3154436 RepID=UPI003331AD27
MRGDANQFRRARARCLTHCGFIHGDLSERGTGSVLVLLAAISLVLTQARNRA